MSLISEMCQCRVFSFGGTLSHFFQEKLKVYNGAYGVFFSKANLQDRLRKIRKTVMYICGAENEQE